MTACLISLYNVSRISIIVKISFASSHSTYNSLLTISSAVLGHFSILIIYRCIKKNQGMLETIEFKNKFGALTEGLNVNTRIGRYWNVIFLTRWLLTLIVMVTLRDYPQLQIMIMLLVSYCVQISLLLEKPMESVLENRITFVNELTVSLYLYALIPLTDFNILFTNIDILGWVAIGIVLFSVALNFSKALFSMGRMAVVKYRKRKIKKEQIESKCDGEVVIEEIKESTIH